MKEYVLTEEQLIKLNLSWTKDERDRVLKELINWINDMDGGDVAFLPNGMLSAPQPFNVKGLLEKIKSLRIAPTQPEDI